MFLKVFYTTNTSCLYFEIKYTYVKNDVMMSVRVICVCVYVLMYGKYTEYKGKKFNPNLGMSVYSKTETR